MPFFELVTGGALRGRPGSDFEMLESQMVQGQPLSKHMQTLSKAQAAVEKAQAAVQQAL